MWAVNVGRFDFYLYSVLNVIYYNYELGLQIVLYHKSCSLLLKLYL